MSHLASPNSHHLKHSKIQPGTYAVEAKNVSIMRPNPSDGRRSPFATGGQVISPVDDALTSSVHVIYLGSAAKNIIQTAFENADTDISLEVDVVSQPEDVLASLDEQPPDCILCEYSLDGISGIELLEQVRARSCDVPFVLLVRGGSEQIASDAIAAGVTEYIPLDSTSSHHSELVDRVVEMFDRQQECVATAQLEGVEAAVEHAADAVVVTDIDGIIEYVNPAFEAVTGFSRKEAVGRNPRIIKSGQQDERYYEEMWDAILDGQVWEEEIINEKKSGEQYVAHQTVAPVTDCQGNVRKFVAIQRDVTVQRKLEEQIDRTATTLSRVYDVTSDTDLELLEKVEEVLDIACRHLDFPVGYATRIRDGTQHILAASGDHERIQTGAEDPLERTYCRRTIAQGQPLVIDDVTGTDWEDDSAFERFGLRCYIGTEITVGGETFGTLCFGSEQTRDETVLLGLRSTIDALANWLGYEIERHRYEWELERKNERLEEFASIVSHDLRNPLNVAMLRLSRAREDIDPDENLSAVADAHERMSTIIDDTLTLAQEGGVVNETTAVSIPDLAKSCWLTVDTADASLEVEGAVTVDGDSDRVRHIFENLFRNSVEHAGPNVTVRVGETDAGFFVADDGPGIDPEDRADVFRSGVSTRRDGTGFGLAIVERIAEAHGWSVSLTESACGGARFEFETTASEDQKIGPVFEREHP